MIQITERTAALIFECLEGIQRICIHPENLDVESILMVQAKIRCINTVLIAATKTSDSSNKVLTELTGLEKRLYEAIKG